MSLGSFGGRISKLGDGLAPSGPVPPAAPRAVPEDLLMQSKGTEIKWLALGCAAISFFILIGLFAIASGSVGTGFVIVAFSLLILRLIWPAVRAIRTGNQQRMQIYRSGLITTATVTSNRTIMQDSRGTKRNPIMIDVLNEVTWAFDVGGAEFSGSTNVASERVESLRPGDPIWVLTEPNDFTQSMEWPAGFILAEGNETAPQDRLQAAPQDAINPES